MSSTYLTSADMSMISRLVAEVRESQTFRNLPRETAAARFLIKQYEENLTAEPELREKLALYLEALEITAPNDNGASGRLPRTEAKRFIDNDSDGTRRRLTETKRRNQLI
ncbi:hypothetical protein C7441_11613 [Pseudaminobacter salicylatoxidans]|uniref:Uncharacterized protein n=1 Tax=Pseudaminobacter salicylatoxidans TaxID=93369 RepID=A0A316BVQ3_PSESE|nr:hypothetical protein [Pseudaminobacter salicylatoxidans]PWJ78348.1 hypothetical protein C7441_11613 [Pseudaminobacter salicylatoxidans]